MWFAFERFLGIVAHWMRTGEWRSEEFQVRGSRTATVLAWLLLGAWFLLCIYIAIDQA